MWKRLEGWKRTLHGMWTPVTLATAKAPAPKRRQAAALVWDAPKRVRFGSS